MASRAVAKPKRKPVRRAAAPPALQRYGARALARLAWLMEHAESEQAQVAAAKELLERGTGAGAAGEAAPQGLDEVVARLKAIRAGDR